MVSILAPKATGHKEPHKEVANARADLQTRFLTISSILELECAPLPGDCSEWTALVSHSAGM